MIGAVGVRHTSEVLGGGAAFSWSTLTAPWDVVRTLAESLRLDAGENKQ